MSRVRASEAEYERFVAARYRPLVRAAVLLGCGPAEAEDAVQDALVRCYTAWQRVRSAADPEAYAYQVLVNSIRRSRRRRWHGEVPTERLPEPPTDPDPEAAVTVGHDVRAALTRLRPAHREVLVLRYYADLSEAQIARALGVAPGTVKSRAARAVAALAADPALPDLLSTAGPATRDPMTGQLGTGQPETGQPETGEPVRRQEE